jgi:hypothetical protein
MNRLYESKYMAQAYMHSLCGKSNSMNTNFKEL